MITEGEINFFQKNGYLIKKSNNQNTLNKIQDFLYSIFSKNKNNYTRKINFFQRLHKNF